MLISIFSAYFFTELRDLAVSARSEEHHLAGFLNKWELPVLILLSFFLQFILAIMGTWRKYRANLTTLVILTLTFADWVANVALAVLFKKETEHHSKEIITLWTPFLLLHLGGPDPIITNFLSDTALWNQLLGLFIQAGVAFYVYTRFRINSSLTYVAIPIFLAGIIKYGERIWALMEAKRISSDSSFFKAKVSASNADQSTQEKKITSLEEYLDDKKVYEEGKHIHKAFCLFKMFKPLFLGRKVKIPSALREIFMPSSSVGSAEDAFRLVEVELEFLYDMLYTKKTTLRPVIFRGICLLSSFAALIAFSIEVRKSAYPEVDIAITYLLLGGAVFLTMYSVISRILSKWVMLLVTVPNNWISKFVDRNAVAQLLNWRAKKKQGIAFMGQHSLMDYCLKTRRSKLPTIFGSSFYIEDNLEKFWLWLMTSRKELVNDDLRGFIHCHLLRKHEEYRSSEFQYGMLSNLLGEKGDGVLKRHNLWDISWSINEVEFDHCLLIWHIATDLLFHFDHGRYTATELGSRCQISKHLSNYMMYLLWLCPNMLPQGMGELRMKETRKEVIGLFINKPLSSTEIVNALFGLDFELARLIPQSSTCKSKSVIAEGCQLALMLRELHELCLWDHYAKWKLIADVWMEMLVFAASRCEWREHSKQLRHGGELLTHVSLLMMHLGLTERIEIVTRYSHELVHFRSNLLGWDWEELPQLPYCLA